MDSVIVLDWDGVVFDDDAFKTAIFTALSKYGLSITELDTLYQSSKDHNGYNDRALAKAVAGQTNVTVDEAFNAIQAVVAQTEQEFVYPDALEFLRSAHSKHRIVVLTAGNEMIQSAKIAASGLESYIDDVVIVSVAGTEHNKANALQSMVSQYDSVLFYDDKISTILHLHEVFRDKTAIFPVWVCRTGTLPPESQAVAITSMDYSEIALNQSLRSRSRALIAATTIRRGDKLLFVQENKGRANGLWTIPIGHVEPDETLLETAQEEVHEETGYSLAASHFQRLIAVDGEHYLGGEQDRTKLMIITCFSAEIEGDNSDAELQKAWLTAEEASARPLRGEWQTALWK